MIEVQRTRITSFRNNFSARLPGHKLYGTRVRDLVVHVVTGIEPSTS